MARPTPSITRAPRRLTRATRALLFSFLALLSSLALLALQFSFTAPAATAQEQEAPQGWDNDVTLGLNFTQNSFSNWEEGGSSSVAWAWVFDAGAHYIQPRYDWETDLNLEYGLVKQEGQDLRKSVDRIELDTVYTHRLGYFVEPFASASFKSQLTLGRDYSAEVEDPSENESFPRTSKFADPLYMTQAVGVGRTLSPGLRSRLGFALREVRTNEFRRYGCTDEETESIEDVQTRDRVCDELRVDTGLESVTRLERTFNEEKTILKSRLTLFFSFEQRDQVDVNWRNELSAELIKYVTLNFALELLYDKDIRDVLQTKQVLGIGLRFSMI